MFTLHLFGGASLDGPSGPLSGRALHRHRVALLALLTAAGERGVSREKLAGYLWPENDAAHARHLVAHSVYVLRRALGEEAILTSGDSVRLNPDVVESDVAVFRDALERGDLDAAAQSYAGAFLDGFYLSDAREFEHWMESERSHLAGEYARAVESLAEAADQAGDFRRAADGWQRLTLHDPYNSRYVVNLMGALTAAGDPGNALREAHEHEEFLKREFGLEPPADLQTFVARLNEGAPLPNAATDIVSKEAGPVEWTPAGPRTVPIVDEREAPRPDPLSRGRVWATVVAVGALAFAAYLVSGRFWVPSGAVTTGSTMRSIAVLPLENLSSDPADAYLADGLTGEVINRLSNVSDLKVISRTSSAKYAGTTKSLQEIAEELDVSAVLEGQVQRLGDRIRINVQLVDANSDHSLWSAHYDREWRHLLDVQSELSHQVASALVAELTLTELTGLTAKPTANVEAYDLFVRARGVLVQTSADLDTVEALLVRAVELDPRFADAWALLANIRVFRIANGFGGSTMSAVAEALNKAREFGPDLPETRLSEGVYEMWGFRNWEKALEHFAAVLRLQPSNSRAYTDIAYTRAGQGRYEEAVANLERALELDPRNPHRARAVADYSMHLRDYAAAERAFERALWIEPTYSRAFRGKALLALLSAGDTARALHVLKEGVAKVTLPDLVLLFVSNGDYFPLVRILLSYFERALDDPAVVEYLSRRCTTCLLHLRALAAARRGEHGLLCAYADSAAALTASGLPDSLEILPYHPQLWRFVGYYLALAGHGRRAIEAAEQAAGMMSISDDFETGVAFQQTLAEVYVMTGEHDRAIDRLGYLLSAPAPLSVRLLRLDPIWDPLRDHPRFQALLARYE